MRGPDWPVAGRGQSVGLLGGSFDPAHAGHVAITRAALARFGLDWVWWVVSPGNPLKRDAPAALDRRLAQARQVMRHPRVHVTDIEAQLSSRFSADTVASLQEAYPHLRFVWLMGSDNLGQFHLWDRWDEIAGRVPLGIFARPGDRLRALNSPTARRLASDRVPPAMLAQAAPPAWSFVNIPLRPESSTELRRAGQWKH
ncbi:nicotinate-nucleotide adenylyltransferase [Palleronia marisminoris]|uniref:Probable nicotinate-nucleotide adenylyltransferase n=1 Tax=Palleronia marisminoris TaxID=315423 RepID=A0A1Y5SF98_9RHOB|nr:nicotinate-nucleotide adenylyltransferase [Palleronia marisminoris]SFG79487.1 nicotinate-nucleotide adenylyltransferase [Palleronia marisminoris]SLN39060.1 Nicotinate-nucleotide adenylyltransferase [Palleronia marisminoris]